MFLLKKLSEKIWGHLNNRKDFLTFISFIFSMSFGHLFFPHVAIHVESSKPLEGKIEKQLEPPRFWKEKEKNYKNYVSEIYYKIWYFLHLKPNHTLECVMTNKSTENIFLAFSECMALLTIWQLLLEQQHTFSFPTVTPGLLPLSPSHV